MGGVGEGLSTVGNVAGQGFGTVLNVADMLMAARQGRLGQSLLARAAALQEPAQRDAIAASPLLSGFMGTYGGRAPTTGFAEVPGMAPTTPGRQPTAFRGNLPPLGGAAQLAQDLVRAKIGEAGSKARHLRRFDEILEGSMGGDVTSTSASSGRRVGRVPGAINVTPTGGSVSIDYPKVQQFEYGTDVSGLPPTVQAVTKPSPLAKDQSSVALGYRLFGQGFNPNAPEPGQVAAIDAASREQNLSEKGSIAARNQRAQIRAARANLQLISQPSDDLGGKTPLDFLPGRFEALTGSFGGAGQRLRQLGIISKDPAAQKAITRMNAQIGSAVTFIKAFGDTANAAVAEREQTIGSLLVDPNRDTAAIAQEKVAFVEQVLSQLDAQLAARGGQLSADDVANIVRQVGEGGLTQTTTPMGGPPATVGERALGPQPSPGDAALERLRRFAPAQ